MRIVALVGDLMDRSRLTAAVPGVSFASTAAECGGADVVVVDLARHRETIAAVRAAVPGARIVAFGPHVEADLAEQAREQGADTVLPRSRFFRDPAAAVA